MKNFCIIFLSFVIIIVTAVGFLGVFPESTNVAAASADYLRVHIRADSNEEEAQAVKYEVRDRVVEYLTPLVAGYQTKAEALRGIEEALPKIAAVATATLRQKGFSYSARAKLTTEQFPTRVYGEYVLPAGEYSALVLELGSGGGDNWWCVVYPPLCFTAGNGQIIYRSKIKEIISRFYS